MGINLYGKTAGIVGTGKIGLAMARICQGFGMKVLAYDPFPNEKTGLLYVSLEQLFSSSDLISLHCPLTPETHHIVNRESISHMKDGVILVNTSRGGLICTEDLIAGIRDHKFFAVGLDVYEEESDFVYEDMSEYIPEDLYSTKTSLFSECCTDFSSGIFYRGSTDQYCRNNIRKCRGLSDRYGIKECGIFVIITLSKLLLIKRFLLSILRHRLAFQG